MRKEILFAIVAGGIFGLIIAFGVWRLNSTLSPEGTSTEATPPPSKAEFGITIAKIQQDQVIVASPLTLSGITKPNAWVVISAEEEDYVIQADSNGSFEVDVELTGGINRLLIAAFDDEGASTEEILQVVFSTEIAKLIDTTKDDSNEDESTESADSVREKVQDKVREAQKVPFAHIGTVTDISEGTFQLKAAAGEIKQVSTNEETVYINEVNTKKTVKEGDVAIGDFLIAMGLRNGNSVLSGVRILITTPPEDLNRKIVYGEIIRIEKKIVTLKLTDGSETSLEFGKRWNGPEISELNEGDKLISIGTFDADSLDLLNVTTIEVVESLPKEE